MRIAVMSDLHVEFERSFRGEARPDHSLPDFRTRRCQLKAAGHPQVGPLLDEVGNVDLVVMAGDIGVGAAETIEYCAQLRTYLRAPVVLVPGNHEYYGADLPRELTAMEKLGAELDVQVLDNRTADFTIAGRRVRILGATLWTDYLLLGPDLKAARMAEAANRLSDHARIGHGNNRMLTPEDAAERHAQARAWLASECAGARREADTVIVVTHHAPTALGIAPEHRTSPLAPAFASEMEEEIRTWAPDLWVFGHTHHSTDMVIGTTRLLAAQRGYVGHEAGAASFRPRVVSI